MIIIYIEENKCVIAKKTSHLYDILEVIKTVDFNFEICWNLMYRFGYIMAAIFK